MIYWLVPVLIVGVFLLLVFIKFLSSRRQSLCVLMYHKISADGKKDYLTVPSTQLEKQFNYLRQEGYTPLLLSELLKSLLNKNHLPSKPLLITFDDGYKCNYTIMYPLLKKLGFKANIFLVPQFLIESANNGNDGDARFLNLSDIHSMDPDYVEFGLHSFNHRSYKNLSPTELNEDLVKSKELLHKMGIRFQPCLAFPYGAYPKRNRPRQKRFFETLAINKIILAFRIGNRLNPLPFRNPLLIQRLDIRGEMSYESFIKKVKKGKSFLQN